MIKRTVPADARAATSKSLYELSDSLVSRSNPAKAHGSFF